MTEIEKNWPANNKVYTVYAHDHGAHYVAKQVVRNVYSWAIEDGRLTFADGNGEYIAIFNQWMYFIKGTGDD